MNEVRCTSPGGREIYLTCGHNHRMDRRGSGARLSMRGAVSSDCSAAVNRPELADGNLSGLWHASSHADPGADHGGDE